MPARISKKVRSQVEGNLTMTDEEHLFLVQIIGPCHGEEVERVLEEAQSFPGGRCIDCSWEERERLLTVVDIEARGFLKLEEEKAGRPLRAPRRGGTAARLAAILNRWEQDL